MLTKQEFLDSQEKNITLLGMSGAGKTTLAGKLAGWGWHHYSCDFQIGTKYLCADIRKTFDLEENPITCEDLSVLSQYVGQIGDVTKGGIALEEFKRRQRQYINAEKAALSELPEAIAAAHQEGFQNFVNDSTGSLCEIDDDDLMGKIATQSLLVYLQTSDEDKAAVIQRAKDYPKPLFFPPGRFDEWLTAYMKEKEITLDRDIEPNDFSAWVFPYLYESRLPKYQHIADIYGITIPSRALADIASEDEFIQIIADHLS